MTFLGPTQHAATVVCALYSTAWQLLLLPDDPPSPSPPPLHVSGLSLVRIEYLYSVWPGSRSLISKVTCRASAGSAAALGLAWDTVTWDILYPQCVLLSLRDHGLCFLVECLRLTQRKKQNKQNTDKFVLKKMNLLHGSAQKLRLVSTKILDENTT